MTTRIVKMITFENGIDIRSRQVDRPQVARFRMSDDTYRYVLIGTDYGHIHTRGGDVRTWQTANGARRWLRSYEPF